MTERRSAWDCDWFELVSAYGRVKARSEPVVHMVRERAVMTLESALERVSAILGVRLEWMELREFVPARHDASWADPRLRRSALASSFVAALELARLGKAELRQQEGVGPLHLRRVAA